MNRMKKWINDESLKNYIQIMEFHNTFDFYNEKRVRTEW